MIEVVHVRGERRPRYYRKQSIQIGEWRREWSELITDKKVIRELRRVSTPGLRRYVKCRELPRVKNGLGMAIVSTPKGLMTDREARSANLGGELLAVVW